MKVGQNTPMHHVNFLSLSLSPTEKALMIVNFYMEPYYTSAFPAYDFSCLKQSLTGWDDWEQSHSILQPQIAVAEGLLPSSRKTINYF